MYVHFCMCLYGWFRWVEIAALHQLLASNLERLEGHNAQRCKECRTDRVDTEVRASGHRKTSVCFRSQFNPALILYILRLLLRLNHSKAISFLKNKKYYKKLYAEVWVSNSWRFIPFWSIKAGNLCFFVKVEIRLTHTNGVVFIRLVKIERWIQLQARGIPEGAQRWIQNCASVHITRIACVQTGIA